jgi:hypothetical protein
MRSPVTSARSAPKTARERSVARRIGSRSACSAACSGETTTPASACSRAGATSSAQGGRPDPVRDQVLAVERDVDDGHGRRGEAGRKSAPGDRDEEIERAVGAVAGAVDEHEPAAAGPGERALGHPRDEAGRDAGVDRVAALRERACACLDGQRMAGGDGALHGDERTAPSRAGQEPPASSRGRGGRRPGPHPGRGEPANPGHTLARIACRVCAGTAPIRRSRRSVADAVRRGALPAGCGRARQPPADGGARSS